MDLIWKCEEIEFLNKFGFNWKESEVTIQKRNKFRSQKDALKEVKEHFRSVESPTLTNSFSASSSLSSSPASSASTSPTQTPGPSSPLSAAMHATQSAANQLCTNVNLALANQSHAIKSIDRVTKLIRGNSEICLETVSNFFQF